MSFFVSVILSILRTARVYKDFSPGTFISKEMVANMNLDVINVPFCHNSAYIIHMWLKFKRVVITFRLGYISQNFSNGSEIIQLLFSESCILVNLS